VCKLRHASWRGTGQRARVRALNRLNFKDFRENPPLIIGGGLFFACSQLSQRTQLRGKIMTIASEKETLTKEEKSVALTHVYLELHLSLQGAMEAAAADLAQLDGSELVAEAA
jgi:hypothetical protein